VVLGAEGGSDRPGSSEPVLGGSDPSSARPPGSLSPEGHEDEDEEEEAVLLWVIRTCSLATQSAVIDP